MTISQITDHGAVAIGKLLSQLRTNADTVAGRNLLEKQIAAICEQADEIETELINFQTNLLDIDEAEGVQLDLIGLVVGAYRENLDDTEYQKLIKAFAYVNKTRGRAEDVISVLDAWLDTDSIIAHDTGAASFSVLILEIITAAQAATANSLIQKTKGTAIAHSLYYAITSPFFGFDASNPDCAGFGVGHLGGIKT